MMQTPLVVPCRNEGIYISGAQWQSLVGTDRANVCRTFGLPFLVRKLLFWERLGSYVAHVISSCKATFYYLRLRRRGFRLHASSNIIGLAVAGVRIRESADYHVTTHYVIYGYHELANITKSPQNTVGTVTLKGKLYVAAADFVDFYIDNESPIKVGVLQVVDDSIGRQELEKCGLSYW